MSNTKKTSAPKKAETDEVKKKSKKEAPKLYVVVNEEQPGEFEGTLNELAGKGYEAIHVCTHTAPEHGFNHMRFHAVLRFIDK